MPGAPHGGHAGPRDAAEASQPPPATHTGQGTDLRLRSPDQRLLQRAGQGEGAAAPVSALSSPTLRTGSGWVAPPLLCKWQNRGRGGDRLRVRVGLSLVVSSAQGAVSGHWDPAPVSGTRPWHGDTLERTINRQALMDAGGVGGRLTAAFGCRHVYGLPRCSPGGEGMLGLLIS